MKSVGFKRNSGLAIMQKLNNFAYTAPPTHRVMPQEFQTKDRYRLPHYTGIYDDEAYQLKLPAPSHKSISWADQDTWPLAKKDSPNLSTKEIAKDESSNQENDDFKELMRRLDKWKLDNMSRNRGLSEARQLAYDLHKKQLDRLGTKALRRTSEKRPTISSVTTMPRANDDALIAQLERDIQQEQLEVEEESEASDDWVEINEAQRRNGTLLTCYGCCETDHGAYDYPMLKTLKNLGILYFKEPTKLRFWFRTKEDIKQGVAQPLDATIISLYRGSKGIAKYAYGLLTHFRNKGINAKWVSKYVELCSKNLKYDGDPSVTTDKVLFNQSRKSVLPRSNRPAVSSITIYDSERERLDLSAGYSYPEDKVNDIRPEPVTVNQMEVNGYGIKRHSQAASSTEQPIKTTQPGPKHIRVEEPDNAAANEQTPDHPPLSSGSPQPSSPHKAKQKVNLSNPSSIPKLLVTRFFNTPRGFTQDEIITMKPELGDHLVEHIRTLQENTEHVIRVDEEIAPSLRDRNRSTSSVTLPLSKSTTPTGITNVQAVVDFFKAQRLSTREKGASSQPLLALKINIVKRLTTKESTVNQLNSTLDQIMDKCTANINLLPVRFGGKESRPLPALIDTGAMINIVSVSICNEFSLPYVSTSSSSVAFNGTRINIVGAMETDVYIAGCKERVIFFVIDQENTNHEVLLGMPFFNQTKMSFIHSPDHSIRASFKFGGSRLIAKVGTSLTLAKIEQSEK